MAQYGFGSGVLWGTPTTDAFGTAITNPSPVIFGVLQEVSVDFAFDTKMLYGQNQFPVAVGRGKGKIGLKAKFAQLNGAMINSLLFGQTISNGIYAMSYDTVGALIPTTPFTITPTVPSTGTFAADLGVITATGVPMTRVASAPTTGQYSVNTGTGVYTFAAADTGQRVYINFQYTATSTAAKRIVIANVPMGFAPTFRCDLFESFNAGAGAKLLALTLNSCVSSKLGLSTKLDDFMVPEFEADAFADANGNVGTLGLSE